MKVVCGCCEPAPTTPREVYNRPSLSAIAYRIGTFATFRQTMLQAIADHPELVALTTRRSDDYAITVLESWAAIADILTFYQERYVNEAFLGTARFRDSLARLASLLDYRLRPGVAARTWIAFQLEPESALTIPVGQKIQSVPEGDALPQMYETVEEIEALSALNQLRVFPAPVPQPALGQSQQVEILDRLQGPAQAAELAPGHAIVIFNNNSGDVPEEKEIKEINAIDDRVEITWTRPVQKNTWTTLSQAYRFKRTFRLYGHDAPPTYMYVKEDLPDHPGRFIWKIGTAPTMHHLGPTLELDGIYEGLEVGQKLLISAVAGTNPATAAFSRVVTIQAIEQVNTSLGSNNPVSASVTRVRVSPFHFGGNLRLITVYELAGDQIRFWHRKYATELSGGQLFLPGVAIDDEDRGIGVEVGRTIERGELKSGDIVYLNEIKKGRTILVDDSNGFHEPLLATIRKSQRIGPSGIMTGHFCHLVFDIIADRDLDQDSDSAFMYGNVAEASHGETVANEIVGSGDVSIHEC